MDSDADIAIAHTHHYHALQLHCSLLCSLFHKQAHTYYFHLSARESADCTNTLSVTEIIACRLIRQLLKGSPIKCMRILCLRNVCFFFTYILNACVTQQYKVVVFLLLLKFVQHGNMSISITRECTQEHKTHTNMYRCDPGGRKGRQIQSRQISSLTLDVSIFK